MPEAVIVATARTPIGRANKGSLVDVRPDDMSAFIIDALLDKLPALDRGLIAEIGEDLPDAASPPARRARTSPGSPPSWPVCPTLRARR